ncbi:MAG: hypothetical protein HY053_03395 [Proteobacteria bacterium]|nr:hypothetical protein [Pseudomonadota bacterium]
MHVLGTLRILALKDLDRLVQAGGQLKGLELEIDHIARQAQGKGAPGLEAAIERLKTKLPEFTQRLTEIGQQKDEEGKKVGDGEIVGGLAQRVVRSEFYQEQFERLTRLLGIEEIGGFVSYDKAVIGRLGGLHEIIRLIGKAFARIQTRLGQGRQQVESSEAAKARERTVAEQIRTNAFQKVAEVAIFLGIFPDAFSAYWWKWADEKSNEEQKIAILVGSYAIGIMIIFRHNFIAAGKALLNTRAVQFVGRTSISITRNLVRIPGMGVRWARAAVQVVLPNSKKARYCYALMRYRLKTGRSYPARIRISPNRNQAEP